MTKGHNDLGSIDVVHRGKTTNTVVGNDSVSDFIENLETAYEYLIKYVPNGYAHRPDLISDVFYASPKNYWLLLLVNNVPNPFEGLKEGDRFFLPKV